ncbi:hypothetical protein [Streptomyces sp. NBC_00162]|uniref:hypothetical protein n=1 Tax=Streptomyces sp. NBC_00162 TaxID=2903629 RepID=UPI00214BDD8B|nr:hypothetical protein [Streptomyces sp. NBC_00162]UUU37734.1 hypothetical protein JIW86_01715 [Streptomyces sp. NBC_00162]
MALEQSGLGYVLAVPKSQQVFGPRIDHLFAQAPDEVWERISCGEGAKGLGSITGLRWSCRQ